MIAKDAESDVDRSSWFEGSISGSQRKSGTQSPVRYGSRSEMDWGKFIGATGKDESFVAGTPEKKTKRYYMLVDCFVCFNVYEKYGRILS